jgi:anti-sigma B factor antagonist
MLVSMRDHLPCLSEQSRVPDGRPVVITSSASGQRARVILAGEIDAAVTGRLSAELAGHIDAGRSEVTVDVSALTFIDCGGLHALRAAARSARAEGGSIRLEGVFQPLVRRIMELTGTVSPPAGPLAHKHRPVANTSARPPASLDEPSSAAQSPR